MRNLLIVSIFAFAACASSIEYFPTHFPDDVVFRLPIRRLPKKEKQVYKALFAQQTNLTDERDLEFLMEIKQKSPSLYEFLVEFDDTFKQQIAKLRPENQELVNALFNECREYRRWELIRQEHNSDDVMKLHTRVNELFHALSRNSKLELMVYFSPLVMFLQKRSSNEISDSFRQYFKNVTEEDRSNLKKLINASVIDDESAFIPTVKDHLPVSYATILDLNEKIDNQAKNLESDARNLVKKFYSICFKRDLRTLYGMEQPETFYDVTRRLAAEFDVLPDNSKVDLIEKFPFVADPLLGWLGSEKNRLFNAN